MIWKDWKRFKIELIDTNALDRQRKCISHLNIFNFNIVYSEYDK